MRKKISIPLFILIFFIPIAAATAKDCHHASDTACLIDQIERHSAAIPEQKWRDNAYKELATAAAIAGDIDRAEEIFGKIDNGDTRAMTIRAIGMAVAAQRDRYNRASYTVLFTRLGEWAAGITHEGARGIAYTYIAMSQAFAGMDEAATITAQAMENAALRNKAFGETAEIQAERGDIRAALNSISHIDTLSFRNKAYGIIADILTKSGQYDKALQAAQSIDNPTRRVKALQHILSAKQAEEATPLSQINSAQGR